MDNGIMDNGTMDNGTMDNGTMDNTSGLNNDLFHEASSVFFFPANFRRWRHADFRRFYLAKKNQRLSACLHLRKSAGK
jgi:hypothetical protein